MLNPHWKVVIIEVEGANNIMEFRVLKYFLMVAREENITKAAALLHLTQPTLSRQLMQLEEELGVTLFHRSKHSIILTVLSDNETISCARRFKSIPSSVKMILCLLL